MSGEEHTLRLNIDATGAEAGARQYKQSIEGIAAATRQLGQAGGAAANLKQLGAALK